MYREAREPEYFGAADMDARPGHTPRRLREHPLDAVNMIVGEIGPRRATSLPEARAAAYLDGRMRLAGLRVSADPFRAPVSIGAEGLLLALLALPGVALYYWLPLPSLFLFAWSLVIAVVAFGRPLPLLARRRPSQNVIATRATTEAPRWRVVLLAPLDSPLAAGRLAQRFSSDRRPVIGRVVACGLLVLFALIGALNISLELSRAGWYGQVLPAAYLLLLAILDVQSLRAAATPGAVNHAGALSALLASAAELNGLTKTEIWAVGLGATNSDTGLADLLRRYPFNYEMTLFVGIEGIGAGRLCYVTSEGTLRERAADPLLLQCAAAADAEDPIIDAEPRHYAGDRTIARTLLRNGRRAMTITCLNADGQVPYRGSMEDTLAVVDGHTIERVVRLVAGIVRRLDATSEQPEA